MMGNPIEFPSSVETAFHPGELLGGKYRVEEFLGKGGMTEVWAGTSERTGKRVAFKVLLREFASSGEAIELFRRQALVASRVHHPNVVSVFDVIEHESRTCIVMERLDGELLSTLLRRKGKLSPEETIALLLPAMRGVAAANAVGGAHRDLKPKNLFLCIGPDGRLITTKVLDFGIAVMREKSLNGASLLATRDALAYMSPENISGAVDIDERADIYGFGVVFFEALTGQLPFVGDLGPELMVRILNEPTPKITTLQSDLPSGIVESIERAMAKDPRDRFRTINDFIQSIEDFFLPSSSPFEQTYRDHPSDAALATPRPPKAAFLLAKAESTLFSLNTLEMLWRGATHQDSASRQDGTTQNGTSDHRNGSIQGGAGDLNSQGSLLNSESKIALVNELRKNVKQWRSRRNKAKRRLVLPSAVDPGIILVLIAASLLLPALHLQPATELHIKMYLGVPAAIYSAFSFVHRFVKDPDGDKRVYVFRLERMISMAEAWMSELLDKDVTTTDAQGILARLQQLHLILRPDEEKV